MCSRFFLLNKKLNFPEFRGAKIQLLCLFTNEK
jgi:hypothetical protein